MRGVRRLGWLGALLLGFGALCGAGGQTSPYDVVIRGGRVIDGTGKPAFPADVAIRNGRIAAITAPGGLKRAVVKAVLDATGKVVAPGFIDMLGQSERSVLTDPYVPSKLFQGITTEITGEGNSIAPRTDAMIATELAGLPRGTSAPEFHTLVEYFHALEGQGIAINLGTYVGAATVRRAVIGDEDRAPTPDELRRMQELVRQAMREGAMGLSTSLMYAPGVYAKTDELVALAKVAGEFGGVYATHLRSEADGMMPALDETFRIAREAKVRVEIFHLKVAGPAKWGRMPQVVRRIDAARAAGLDIGADTYAYTYSGNPAAALVPPWAHAGGNAAMVARLADPAVRARIRAAMEHDRSWDNEWFMVQGPQGIAIASTYTPELKPLIGKTLAEVAASQAKDPHDCLMDLVEQDPRMGVLLATMSEGDVETALKQPWMAVGLDASGTSASDPTAGRHPRAFGTFPRILRLYVREKELMSLEEAIRRFTSLPASRMRLADRGVLNVGAWADVVVFDPAKVRDRATYEQPNQLAEGMDWVLVNGVPVIAQGKLTQNLPGKVMRGPGYRTRH